jgi:hypothetical protein
MARRLKRSRDVSGAAARIASARALGSGIATFTLAESVAPDPVGLLAVLPKWRATYRSKAYC